MGGVGLAIVQSEGNVVGLITDGDIRRLIKKKGKSAFDCLACDYMTLSPLLISPLASTHDAIELMDSKKVSALIVVDDSTCVGIFQK